MVWELWGAEEAADCAEELGEDWDGGGGGGEDEHGGCDGELHFCLAVLVRVLLEGLGLTYLLLWVEGRWLTVVDWLPGSCACSFDALRSADNHHRERDPIALYLHL